MRQLKMVKILMKLCKNIKKFFRDFSAFIMGVCLSFIVFFLLYIIFKQEISFGIEAISTIASIVISVVSIIYTYISGEKTSRLLDDLEGDVKKTVNQNKALVEEIHNKEVASNFDEQNIKSSYSSDK